MKSLHKIAYILVIIGALNWGLEALGYNVVYMILGGMPNIERLVYLLVGVAAVYEVVTHKKNCKDCAPSGGMSM